ncbi:hypothetical protein pb186bvf_016725 [Paramecium bursaria]
MAKRDLLKCELEISPKELVISRLLNPKPKFEMPQSSLLQSIKKFIPQIQQENEKLKDQEYLKQIQMEDQNQLTRVKITDVIKPNSNFSENQIRKHFRRTGKSSHKDKKFINMDLYMGVFDLKDPQKEQMETKTLIQEL